MIFYCQNKGHGQNLQHPLVSAFLGDGAQASSIFSHELFGHVVDHFCLDQNGSTVQEVFGGLFGYLLDDDSLQNLDGVALGRDLLGDDGSNLAGVALGGVPCPDSR